MMAQHDRHSRIFIVRLWTEEREANTPILRGMVRNVTSGETRYFRAWHDFVAFLDKERQVQEEQGPEEEKPEMGPETEEASSQEQGE